MTAAGKSTPGGELAAYLAAITGPTPAGQLLELRYPRPGGGMAQRFFDAADPAAAIGAVTALARRHDVYVGAALRARRAGTRDAVGGGWVLWADCDGPTAAAALAAFSPGPAIVVRSGSRGHRHGYWPLSSPLDRDALEHANRRLAAALGADRTATDAARVLRCPGTRNHKHRPPVPVTVETLTGERFDTPTLLAALPATEPSPPPPAPAPARVGRRRRTSRGGGDRLRAIAPAVYVEALTGLTPGRDRKIRCPLHEDRTPSLHVYNTPAGGWFCFGCSRGGDIYDLGAELLALSTRGTEFRSLKRALRELLGLDPRDPSAPRRGQGRPQRSADVSARNGSR